MLVYTTWMDMDVRYGAYSRCTSDIWGGNVFRHPFSKFAWVNLCYRLEHYAANC